MKEEEPVDDIVKNMKNPHLMLSSVNDDEYEDYASSIDNYDYDKE